MPSIKELDYRLVVGGGSACPSPGQLGVHFANE